MKKVGEVATASHYYAPISAATFSLMFHHLMSAYRDKPSYYGNENQVVTTIPSKGQKVRSSTFYLIKNNLNNCFLRI